MKCVSCGQEITEEQTAIQVRKGVMVNGNFEAEEDLEYYHDYCYVR